MNNDFYIISGYKFKMKEYNMYNIVNNLLLSDQAICALDCNGTIYCSGEVVQAIKPAEYVYDWNEYINNIDIISDSQKQILYHLYDETSFRKEHSLYNEDFMIIKLKDFFIKYEKEKKKIKVSCELIAFANNTYDFIFHISIPKKFNPIKIQHILVNNCFDSIIVPPQYTSLVNIELEGYNEDYVEIPFSHSFYKFVEFFHVLIPNHGELIVFQKRSSILINKAKVTKNDITKLLYQCDTEVKQLSNLKDYRLANDYSHYSDYIQSVLVGKNVSIESNWILMLDSIIVNEMLKDQYNLFNTFENHYSLKELLKLQLEYEKEISFKCYFPISEGNDYIIDIFAKINKYDFLNSINRAIERKKSIIDNKKSLIISVFGCLLTVPSLYDYVLKPIIIYTYNINNPSNKISTLDSPYDFIFVGILLLLSLLLCYLFSLLIENKKTNKYNI